MVSTVAVLSDTHGVLPVLQAVLAEPDVAAAELVVVCGDLAAGPMPVETLDALAALGDRGLLVRGNADRELVAVAEGSPSQHPESTWAGAQCGRTRSTSCGACPTRSPSTWMASDRSCAATAPPG